LSCGVGARRLDPLAALARPVQAEQPLLHHVLRLADAAEHPVGDGERRRAQLVELLLGHRLSRVPANSPAASSDTGASSRARAWPSRSRHRARLLFDLIQVGWGGAVPAFRQVFSSMYIPSAGEEQKRWYDDMQQASSSGEIAARLWKSRTQTEISDTARRINLRALVVHARDDRAVPYEEGRRLASLLPNARFVTLETDHHILQEGEPAWELFIREVRAFLGDDERTPTAAADLSELSEREREVLRLVAAGMSNEQIAERLFLSTRTVERHLSNVYAKLRLSGKSARAAAAARFPRT